MNNPVRARPHAPRGVGIETEHIDSRAIQTTQKCGGSARLICCIDCDCSYVNAISRQYTKSGPQMQAVLAALIIINEQVYVSTLPQSINACICISI